MNESLTTTINETTYEITGDFTGFPKRGFIVDDQYLEAVVRTELNFFGTLTDKAYQMLAEIRCDRGDEFTFEVKEVV